MWRENLGSITLLIVIIVVFVGLGIVVKRFASQQSEIVKANNVCYPNQVVDIFKHNDKVYVVCAKEKDFQAMEIK